MFRRNTLRRAPWVKVRPRFGRRLGWYAIARLRKPKLIAETGIHDGLGSALLLRALEINARDGVEGRLISFDPRAETGWLVPEPLRSRWEPRFVTSDDPERGLPAALEAEEVDFFIHDSEHTHAVEMFEFSAAVEHAAPGCVLLSDNAHATSALKDIAGNIGREYAFYPEKPKNHWYPGAGIGLVVCR
jgi:predicted O-methyltransferase YrrM